MKAEVEASGLLQAAGAEPRANMLTDFSLTNKKMIRVFPKYPVSRSYSDGKDGPGWSVQALLKGLSGSCSMKERRAGLIHFSHMFPQWILDLKDTKHIKIKRVQ